MAGTEADEGIQRLPIVGSLEIDEDLAWEQREWIAERVAWVAMGLILLIGLLGIFGSGPLSSSRAHDGALTVRYPSVLRHRSPESMRLDVTSAEDSVELTLNSSMGEDFELQSVVPEPVEQRSSGGNLVLVFSKDPGEALSAHIDYQVLRPGVMRVSVGSPGASLELRQVVLP